jgi:UDP:flavonoid glycosyltransferase YjiC (YdhE family)
VLPRETANMEKELDVDELRAKVRLVLSTPVYKERAQRMAEAMRQYDSPTLAANHLEEVLRLKTAGL